MSPRETGEGRAPWPRNDADERQRRRRQAEREHAERLLPPRLVLLALAGLLLFGYPFLAVFSQPLRLGGVPLLYVYLFVAWVVFIAAIARLVDPGNRHR